MQDVGSRIAFIAMLLGCLVLGACTQTGGDGGRTMHSAPGTYHGGANNGGGMGGGY